MPFTFSKTEVEDVCIVAPRIFRDERGFFMEAYAKKAFEEVGIEGEMVQMNHSRSAKGVLRGLHFQRGTHAQAKLVRCLRGEILDVAVDLRRTSKTFARHIAVTLSEENRLMLYVPRGFAHGFYTVSDAAEVEYLVDNDYAPEHEGGVIWSDPDLAINWPTQTPAVSEKDSKWPRLKDLKELF